jgi:hypothetical protein
MVQLILSGLASCAGPQSTPARRISSRCRGAARREDLKPRTEVMLMKPTAPRGSTKRSGAIMHPILSNAAAQL